MKKIKAKLITISLIILLSACTTTGYQRFSRYNFSFQNTVSIFLINADNQYHFCIPLQYMGDFSVSDFEFLEGTIQIGGYDISLTKETVLTSMVLEELDQSMNLYTIFIEKPLSKTDMSQIIDQYEQKNTYSQMAIWFDITINGEEQKGNGLLDDFELSTGPINENIWLFPHLEILRLRYFYFFLG